ncbi:cation transporter [Pseudomonas sp. FFUP_PS_473]|jgi:hypothetical protein|uniref:DUF6482 family protein n=1 Tax=Pseudomonas TaxID=286 RepID=UPI00081172E5|nr:MULTISPECIES: DUF6482 family protein [Pseudomonas]ATR82627.1 cation transporter [Pseudomonas sp. HLS-6]MEE3635979.1 DUF6482 family protein [Pseudomonas sp. AL 58]PLP92504.1 cation transporter [Pseudomonas sp. FFUP_PS_473]WJM94605.1 DUF6482 family protein [Pseudomonas defluvii]
MNLQQLSGFADAGRIDELNLVSLEGGIYVLQALMEGKLHPLLDEQGHNLCLRSTTHAREVLQHLPEIPCLLVQKVVHDEMCGLGNSADAPLKLPFSIRSTW